MTIKDNIHSIEACTIPTISPFSKKQSANLPECDSDNYDDEEFATVHKRRLENSNDMNKLGIINLNSLGENKKKKKKMKAENKEIPISSPRRSVVKKKNPSSCPCLILLW